MYQCPLLFVDSTVENILRTNPIKRNILLKTAENPWAKASVRIGIGVKEHLFFTVM